MAAKKKEEETKEVPEPEVPEVSDLMKFKFPDLEEVEGYAVRTKEGKIIIRTAEELEEMKK